MLFVAAFLSTFGHHQRLLMVEREKSYLHFIGRGCLDCSFSSFRHLGSMYVFSCDPSSLLGGTTIAGLLPSAIEATEKCGGIMGGVPDKFSWY